MTQLYRIIASVIQARKNCQIQGNLDWFERHTDKLLQLQKQNLPSGSGIDTGTVIDLDRSNENKIVLLFSFHHMDEHGFYAGWTQHECIVKPNLVHDIELKITGDNRNSIKDYLHDVFMHALIREIIQ